MPRAATPQRPLGFVAVVIAVLVAGGAVTYVASAPAASARAPLVEVAAEPGPSAATVPATEPGASAPSSAGSPPAGAAAPAVAEAPLSDEERAAAERLSERMRRLARDLEFTPGLREPPQQTVVEKPEPWRPDPLASEEERPVIQDVRPTRAPAAGGTRVTIRGRNLRVTQVMFGRFAARILGITPDLITVEAPRAAAGPVSIVLTNDDGTYAIASEPFTYVD